MMIKIGLWLILSVFSAIFYSLGGIGKPFNTKYRDLGCSFCTTGLLLVFWHPVNLMGWLIVLASFLALFGALTTYWDWLFGYDNFYMHGFMCALSFILLFMVGMNIWFILLRCIILSLAMGLWSKWQGNVIIEESGRGFVLCATIPLLLI